MRLAFNNNGAVFSTARITITLDSRYPSVIYKTFVLQASTGINSYANRTANAIVVNNTLIIDSLGYTDVKEFYVCFDYPYK